MGSGCARAGHSPGAPWENSPVAVGPVRVRQAPIPTGSNGLRHLPERGLLGPPLQTWTPYHVAVVAQDGALGLYIDGSHTFWQGQTEPRGRGFSVAPADHVIFGGTREDAGLAGLCAALDNVELDAVALYQDDFEPSPALSDSPSMVFGFDFDGAGADRSGNGCSFQRSGFSGTVRLP